MKRLWPIVLLMLLLVACGGAEDAAAPEAAEASRARSGEPGLVSGTMAAESEMMEEAPAEEAAFDTADGGGGEAGGVGAAQVLGNRQIIYNASLTIEADDPRVAAQRMQALASSYGGFVSNANVFEQGEDRYVATVQLRIPSSRFDSLMGELRELGNEVLSESISTQDVTAEYADLEARIRNLERTEIELQALLTEARENSGKTEDVLRVYNEMNNVRGQIERLQGQLNVLADAVDLATVNVEFVPPPLPARQTNILDEEWAYSEVLREALRQLTEGLQALATVGTYVVVTLLPLGLILGAIGLAIFWIFRRALQMVVDTTRGQRTAPAPTTTPPPPSTPPQE